MERKAILLGLSVIFFTGMAVSASIGVLPGELNMGNIEPGESVDREIYLRTVNIGQNFTVNPSANSIGANTIFSSNFDNRARISEVSSEDWWAFERTTIDPSTQVSRVNLDIPNDEIPEMQGVVRATFSVPQDAEPGVRYGYIHLNSDLGSSSQTGGAGAGTSFVAPTRIRYSLNVPGNVDRDIVVQDIRGFRTETNRASVEVLLRNQGSVTASAENFDFDILDSQGNKVKTLTASGMTLKPGESEWTNAIWSGNVQEGDYQLDGEIDYLTGSTYASGGFSLGGIVEIMPDDSPAVDGEERESVPLWLVIMVLVIFGVLMWSFGIDPFWILLIVGILGISAFILMSGLSNLLLVVLLIVVGIVVYGGL